MALNPPKVNIKEFEKVNFLNMPVFAEGYYPEHNEWPEECFVESGGRMIFLEVNEKRKKVYIFDSFGGSTSPVDT